MDQFGMSESLLLHEQVQVLTLPAGLVEREFLDEEVLLLGLDRTGDLGDVEQPALGKCGRDLEWHLWRVGTQDAPSSVSVSGRSSD